MLEHPVVTPPVGDSERVTPLYATGSSTNPYVEITDAAAGAANGHYGHGDDIIPSFTYQREVYAAIGDQRLFGTGCVVVAPAVVTPPFVKKVVIKVFVNLHGAVTRVVTAAAGGTVTAVSASSAAVPVSGRAAFTG